MTLAAILAQVACTGSIPVPGTVHDPSQPLVLGNQAGNDYAVLTWDNVAHRLQIQSVYKPADGPIQQSTLTFRYDGQLLINNQTIAQLPEIAAAVTAAQAAATAAAASASTAAASATNAGTSASNAATSANTASTKAADAALYANAPDGTEVPGGGDSAAVSAQKAASTAEESRELDVSDLITTSETFESGFMFTERQCNPTGEMVVTIPPGIFSSAAKRRQWAAYKLRSATGSVKFVGQAGGTNLVTPTAVARGRAMKRLATTGVATRNTLIAAVATPVPIVAGEILIMFNAQHNGTANALSLNLSNTGPTLTWDVIHALPANASAAARPDFYVARAMLPANFPAGGFNISFDEGVQPHFQACDWWFLDGTEGSLPFFAMETRTTTQVQAKATLLALPAQSLVLGVGAMGGPASGSLQTSATGTSANLTKVVGGQTAGVDDVAAADDNQFKNQAHAILSGVSTVAGDFLGTQNFSFSNSIYKVGMALVGYKPKSVIGGGTVVMNYEADRQSLTVPYGVAELWFHPDGKTVDVRTPKP